MDTCNCLYWVVNIVGICNAFLKLCGHTSKIKSITSFNEQFLRRFRSRTANQTFRNRLQCSGQNSNQSLRAVCRKQFSEFTLPQIYRHPNWKTLGNRDRSYLRQMFNSIALIEKQKIRDKQVVVIVFRIHIVRLNLTM